MALNRTVPWKFHLSGSGSSGSKSWWARWKDRIGKKARPTLVKEQDLDHLGALHEAALHAKRR